MCIRDSINDEQQKEKHVANQFFSSLLGLRKPLPLGEDLSHRPATAFVMTMFNVRLGWWPFNPTRPESGYWASRRCAPLELSKELLGMVSDTPKFLYLSDGGTSTTLVVRTCEKALLQDCDLRLRTG